MPSANLNPYNPTLYRVKSPQTRRSATVAEPYTTIHQRIDYFLRQLMYLLPICSQKEQERLWFTLQEIFTISQSIYAVSPQLPRFLVVNRQQRNLRRIAMVVSHLPQQHLRDINQMK